MESDSIYYMAKVKKVIIEPAKYESPDGVVEVTPERARKWAGDFAKMKRERLRVPVPWGHQSLAFPGTDEAAFAQSRFNAGFVVDIQEAPGGKLEAIIDAPGLTLDESTGALVDPKTGSAIDAVSIGIAERFVDGKGRVWNDVITHVALTPTPVWADQDGFKNLSATTGKVTRLSLEGKQWRLANGEKMADATSKSDHFKEALEGLASRDIVLPEDTTPENFMERLCIAIVALKGRDGDKDAGKDKDDMSKDKDETKDDKADAIPHEERMPLQQLSLDKQPKWVQDMARRQVESDRRAARDRIDALKKRGVKKEVIARLENQIDTIRLSLAHDGMVAQHPVFETLKLLEDALPEDLNASLTQRLATGSAVANPLTPIAPSDNEKLAEAERLFRRNAGVKEPK